MTSRKPALSPAVQTFALSVKKRRMKLQMTQVELQEKAKMGAGALSHIENLDFSFSLDVAVRLAAALGVKVGDLLGEVPGA